MLRVTIWMNMPTFYQADLFRALMRTGEVDLQVVFAREISADRREIGWSNDLEGYSSTFLSQRWGPLDALRLAWRQRDRIHIVNGLWAEPSFLAALCAFAVGGSTYLIYSEAPNPETERSTAAKVVRTVVGRTLALRARGWLPISRFAVEFYRSLGARCEAMYPFGYFRAHPPECVGTRLVGGPDAGISAVFVGQVIERKGIDLLLHALGSTGPALSLRIIGDGALRTACQQRARELGIADRVVFEGVLPASEIPARIARADVLILPSRWDGWGLVVNEALAAGVPVVVSDRCGAAEVIRHGVNGYVFRAGDVDDLRRCLQCFELGQDARLPMRQAARVTGDALAAEIVAPYLVGCLQHLSGERALRPTPPWTV